MHIWSLVDDMIIFILVTPTPIPFGRRCSLSAATSMQMHRGMLLQSSPLLFAILEIREYDHYSVKHDLFFL